MNSRGVSVDTLNNRIIFWMFVIAIIYKGCYFPKTSSVSQIRAAIQNIWTQKAWAATDGRKAHKVPYKIGDSPSPERHYRQEMLSGNSSHGAQNICLKVGLNRLEPPKFCSR